MLEHLLSMYKTLGLNLIVKVVCVDNSGYALSHGALNSGVVKCTCITEGKEERCLQKRKLCHLFPVAS